MYNVHCTSNVRCNHCKKINLYFFIFERFYNQEIGHKYRISTIKSFTGKFLQSVTLDMSKACDTHVGCMYVKIHYGRRHIISKQPRIYPLIFLVVNPNRIWVKYSLFVWAGGGALKAMFLLPIHWSKMYIYIYIFH